MSKIKGKKNGFHTTKCLKVIFYELISVNRIKAMHFFSSNSESFFNGYFLVPSLRRIARFSKLKTCTKDYEKSTKAV